MSSTIFLTDLMRMMALGKTLLITILGFALGNILITMRVELQFQKLYEPDGSSRD